MSLENEEPEVDPATQPPASPAPAAPAAEAGDKEVTEGFAFALFCFENRSDDPGVTDDELRDAWQRSADVRKEARRRATGLTQLLDASGLGVKSSNRAALRKRLEYAITTPPREAYSADE